jgi:predicted acylesterase/phospholipase RssA
MENQFTPFESIGLCFSGGGYRATFFSLGVISYLHRVYFKDKPLLKHVEAISSVSGGSLLAVAYSLAEKDVNFDFAEWYKNFYLSFTPKNDRLLENAVAKLEKRKVWLTHPYKKSAGSL